MSYSTIKAIWPGEKHEDLEELRNSWGTAPHIWDTLAKAYLGVPHWLEADDRLWNLWTDKTIPKHQRAVFMFTFDRAYVAKKDYERMAHDIRSFLQDFSINSSYVNHWPHIADLFDSNPDIPAIGLYCTSVSDDPFCGDWNEEKEEYDPTNWDECFDLYAELDENDSIAKVDSP